MVFLPNLLGGIGDVLGDKFVVPGQKDIVVVPSSSKASPSSFIGLLLVDPGSSSVLGGALGLAVTKDSLLSEDIAAHEWSSCAHLPATMELHAGQSGTRMAGDL
ncbi:unnamed protein product [Lactuca saligna]|uniref:Uncharacterized protein n=1 Tax=Lactuca saligna TaxID=75948 RepID=A0AA35V171_LACSI|nr:unnamed protein product [Lactuca saligna]